MTMELNDEQKAEQARLLARQTLRAFCIGMSDKFTVARHHRKIARKLEDVLRGKCQRLIITMPPRHGKTLLASQLFPAWYLGHKPENSVIITSYGADLSTDFGRYIRNAIQSNFYQSVFPDVLISEDSNSKSRFHTSAGGALIAVGRGGTITGRGSDLLVIDDIFRNRQDASSQAVRKMVLEWYRSTLRTRLMPGGSIIMVNTRWHEDDLIGHILTKQLEDADGMQWEHLNFPAIDDQGHALWPERFPVEDLLQIKKDIGASEFEALYQQNPTPPEGSIIKRDWIKYYRQLPDKITVKIQSWDMAFKQTENSDYVVGQVWGLAGASCYLIDQVRARMDFVGTKNAVKSLSAKHPMALTKLVEDKANGPAIISELKGHVMGIKPVEPYGSKAARLSSIAPLFEAGNVYLPDPSIAPWVHDLVEELIGFPQMKNDDQVDALSQSLSHLKEYSAHSLSKLLTL